MEEKRKISLNVSFFSINRVERRGGSERKWQHLRRINQDLKGGDKSRTLALDAL